MAGENVSLYTTRILAAANGQSTNHVLPKTVSEAEKLEKEKVKKELLEKFNASAKDLTKTDKLALHKNKENQKVRKEALIKYYQSPIFGLTEKEAKEFAEFALKNEIAEERVEHTRLYFYKDQYEANKKKDEQEGYEAKKIPDSIKKIMNKRPELFFEQNPDGSMKLDDKGNMIFSQTKYNLTLLDHTGDYRMELSEREGLADELGTSKGKAKKMAKLGGFDYEKDMTWLYRAGAILGATGLSTLVGGLIGKVTPTNVDVSSLSNVLDKETGELLDTSLKEVTVNKTNTGRFAAVGALTNLLPAIALSFFIKDHGDKSILSTTAENIVNNGTASIKDDEARKVMDGVLQLMDAAQISDENQIRLIEIVQGIASGKHTTDREIAVLAQKMKDILVVEPEEETEGGEEAGGTEETGGDEIQGAKPADPTFGKEVIARTIKKTEDKTVTEDVFQYKHTAGEYWAGIAEKMYGVDSTTAYYIGKEIKSRHGFAPSSGDMPAIVNLPKEITVKGKTYTRIVDEEKDIKERKVSTEASNGKRVATSSFQAKTTTTQVTTEEKVYDGVYTKTTTNEKGEASTERKAAEDAKGMTADQALKWIKDKVDQVKKFFE